MAMNLQAVMRITAKTEGIQEIGNLSEAIERLTGDTEQYKSASDSISEDTSFRQSFAAKAAAIVGLGAGFYTATSAAVSFESGMADVRKVVDGIQTPAAFREISQEIIELSRQMPITAEGFAQIYAAAGRSGVAREDLRQFAIQVAQVSVAFDMTAEQAGTAMGQIRSALGLSLPDLNRLMDTLNAIDDSSGASAAGLVEFMTRAGATGKIAGLTAEQTAAFGAAMMEAGFESEVAATSFNNMIKALSRGPSMTERQVDALRRLGYSMADAKAIESELTRAAETESRRRVDAARDYKDDVIRLAQEQSDRRLEIARNETDGLSKEINRRFRNELQVLQDGWDDQQQAQEDAAQDRADAQIKALQRQERAEISALEASAKATGASINSMVDAIKDRYDDRVDAIRDALDRELTLQRRAARDQQQAVRDQLEDRRELEMKAVEKRFDQFQKKEKEFVDAQKSAAEQRFDIFKETEEALLQKQKAGAKVTGEELAKQSMQGFADRMQQDAIGTITEVFALINKLPKSQQISVMSDLFGDEARGLVPMINNVQRLNEIMKTANDTAGNAGSVAREYGIRSQTSANQLQLFNNALDSFKIALGDALLPILTQVLGFVTPLVNGLAGITTAASGFITTIAQITGLALIIGPLIGPLVTFGTVLSGVFSLATLAKWGAGLKILAFLPGPMRLVAAAMVALGLAASPLGPIINAVVIALTALQAVKFIGGILSGVAGIKVALGGLLTWIGATLVPGLLAFFSGPIGWTVLAVAAVVAMAVAFREPLLDFVKWLWQWGEPIRQFWINLWDETQRVFATAGQLAWATFYDLMIRPWLAVWDTLKGPLEAFWRASQAIFQWGAKAAYAVVWQLLIQPWLNVWRLLDDPVTDLWGTIRKLFTSGAAAAMGVIDAVIVRPWQDVWSGLQSAAAQLISWLSGAFSGIGQAFNQYVASPIAALWRGVTDGIANGMRSAADFVQGIWTGLVNGLTGLARSFVTGWVSAINAVVSAVNRLITGFNQLPGPDIALIPTLSVPAFAQGGVVTHPTLAMVGDGGEPEYIIPQSKMAAASAAFAGGARGAAVLNGSSAAAPTTAPVVNIQTGPVMQADGKNWVTVDDLQRAVQQATGQVYSQLRTPRGRRAVGIA